MGYAYVPVRNLEKAVQWYEHVLGLERKEQFVDRKEYNNSQVAVFHFGELRKVALLLFETENEPVGQYVRNGLPFPIFAMNCTNIEETYHALQEKGVRVEEIITLGNNEAKYFYFWDLDGNMFEAAWSVWDETV
jgi:catechol 2,3-dioxygenase-like lactoylglutathione lyase family enzyme